MTRKERGKYRNQDPESHVTMRPKRVQKKEASSKDSNSMNDSSFIEIIEYNEDGTEKKALPAVNADLIDERSSSDINENMNIRQELDQNEAPNQSSSFIEVIEHGKEEPSSFTVELVDCATTSAEEPNHQLNEQSDADKENANQVDDEPFCPKQQDDEPVSIFVDAGKESGVLATSESPLPASKSKARNKKKKGAKKGKKDYVKSIDPSLLKTPPISCFKASRSNLSDSPEVRKSFRFADTRGEGPLCDIKEVDYEKDRKYGFRKTTIKKTMYSEIL